MLHTQPPARPAPSPQPSHLPTYSISSSNSPSTTVDLASRPGGSSPVKPTPELDPNTTGNQTVSDTPLQRPGTADGNSDDAGCVNRWSESTASSGRSSRPPETQPSGPDIERGLSKTPTDNVNHNLNNNDNHNVNNNPEGYLPGRKTPTTELPSINGSTSNSIGQESEGIPTLPPISTSASDSLDGGHSGAFNDLDFFGGRTANLSPTAAAPHEKRPMTETTGESMHGSPDDPNARHRHNDNHDRERRPRGSSQKTVLSRALQKANTAVLLDNAMNYEGAIEAYMDACGLLQQVMMRTSGGEERQKLQEIRSTYIIRINELRRLGLSGQSDGKALPERPLSDDSLSGSIVSPPLDLDEDDDLDDEQHVYEIATATSARVLGNVSQPPGQVESRSLPLSQIPPRRQSLLPSPFDGESHPVNSSTALHERTRSNSFGKARYLHPSPKKPSSPLPPIPQTEIPVLPSQPISQFASSDRVPPAGHGHARGISNGSTSWLDTIDESGVSSDESVRSNSPTVYLRSRHNRGDSRGTEAEFDAALDAAVEAAYDEGYEPDQSVDVMHRAPVMHEDPVSNVRRNIELAKQRVREAEREARALSAKERDKRRIQEEALHGDFSAIDSHYEDYEAEEEERILEEMMDDFDFDMQSKSALPRQSGSSSFSGRTASSSIPSNFTTAGTPLSTLAEEDVLPPSDVQETKQRSAFPSLQNLPPTSALPPPPSSPPPPVSASTSVSPGTQVGPSVRERRLSGRNPKELVIETDTKLPAGSEGPRTMPSTVLGSHAPSPFPQDEPKTSIPSSWKAEANNHTDFAEKSPFASAESLPLQSPVASGFTKTLSQESGSGAASTHTSRKMSLSHQDTGLPSSKIRPPPRPIKVSIPSDGPSYGPTTPATARPDLRRAQTFSSLATQAAQNFFDTDIHSPTNLGFPNPSVPDPPMPLEACPQSFLLRPFWLMRCLYQTITHSRGAYITTRLFIPSDVWRVRNVKIKAIDEKIANCDLLTAALLKLATIDMFDADAVLEEMQTLEGILDQVQAVLTKKLGSEVGVQGAMSLFKMADDGSPMGDQPSGRSSSSGGKSYLSSWRKLRSKSSGTSSIPSQIGARDGSARDTMTLHSLPMTEAPETYSAKKSVTQLQCTGPNANYMSALARLFDAAQVIDQIARQVEDPGLRHSSQTLVGLELSTRHAAEFFGFYICRFVLNDVGLLLDKFIKRSGEWITS